MGVLTQAESDRINNSVTVKCKSQALFEHENGLAHAQDLGGLVVYFEAKDLVAFYDYERKLGAIFEGVE